MYFPILKIIDFIFHLLIFPHCVVNVTYMYYGCKGIHSRSIHTTLHIHTNIAVFLKIQKKCNKKCQFLSRRPSPLNCTFFRFLSPYDTKYRSVLRIHIHIPLSPSLEILLRSRKCVPITVSPTASLSLNCILIRWHSGGNISVNTICSFQTGL